jgi:Zn ribbon nucleic-acid-binding protein
MAYALTKKSSNLITEKIIDGEKYFLCDKNDDVELWISANGLAVKERACSKCGYSGPALDRHHIHGRKNSDVTIDLCSNCHRELHMGAV